MAKKKTPLEEFLAQPIPVGGTAVQSVAPLGVPEMVMGENGPEPFQARGQNVRFYDGDEWQPAGMSAPEIAELQRMMAAAGIIPRGATYRNGVWDDTSRLAYKSLLGYANGSGLSIAQSLQEWQRTAADEKVKVDPYLKPSPAEISQTVKRAVRSKLGREVTNTELLALVQEFSTLDEQAYGVNSAAQAAVAAGGTASVDTMDAEASFEEMLDTRYRPEIERREGILDLSKQREGVLGNVFALDRYIEGAA